MHELKFIPLVELKRIIKIKDRFLMCKILADALRINTLYMIRFAGSGHPGSSFSAIDIMVWLHFAEMKDEDIFFSSKGHDVPALYSILIAEGKLPFEKIHQLRRLGGLPGHPDIGTPGITTNTGSLGMGISKAHGIALANRLKGVKSNIYVLTGDGELQEGQIWESLGPAANANLSEITVIVDHNKIQSDVYVKDTSDLGNLDEKWKAFGWATFRCDGNNAEDFSKTLAKAKKINDRPQVIIADTKKGKGVSFMERLAEDGLYKFHSGTPSIEQYLAAFGELSERVNKFLGSAGEKSLEFESKEIEIKPVSAKVLKLNIAYGDELVKIARERKDIFALDADLVLDTGLMTFKKEFPERYVECGIAEQDMVSIAGGLALRGTLPVVHSFACFLSTRPNEQIYNNATERTKIIYTASLAGLLPATPGHSHQSVRDISALGSVPGLIMFEPSCESEVKMAIRWAVDDNPESTYIRICNVPAEISYELPDDYKLQVGKGVEIAAGKDILFFAYGPIMLEQAMGTRKILSGKNISAAVVNLPWLNRADAEWLKNLILPYKLIVMLDNHYTKLGQGEMIAALIAHSEFSGKLLSCGVEEIPISGQNTEVLKYHKLDAESIAKRTHENYIHI